MLTYNGNFTSWANSSSPKEFYAFGGATIARTTDEYSGAYGCEITAVGATSVQGLACDLDRFEMGEENWVTVCAKIKRPATNAGDIKIIANVGFDRVGTVFQEELPDDEYILVSRSFNIGDTAGAYIVICPASSPSGGESIKVDEVVIMTGKQGPTGFIGKASPHVSLYDEQAGSSREMITFSYASSGPPSSGAYVKGDRVYIPPVASGAEGYVALLDIPDASSPPANAWATFGVIGAAIP